MYPFDEVFIEAKNLISTYMDDESFRIALDENALFEWRTDHPHPEFYIFGGYTKYAFLCRDLEWVIKTDQGKRAYCKTEYENFVDAQKLGLDEFFAETYWLCNCYGRDFYIQEKLTSDQDAALDRFYSYAEQYVDKHDYENEDPDHYWDAVYAEADELDDDERIRAIFGCSLKVEQLVDFIINHRINDLHEGNFGWHEDGNMAIFDFSGF